MLLPMMGFLFSLVVVGFLLGFSLFLMPRARRLALIVMLPLVLSGVFALLLSWGLSIGVESYLHSDHLAGIGFFTGYFGGGALGAIIGLIVAIWASNRYLPPMG